MAGALLAEHFLSKRIALLGSWVGVQRTYNTGVAFGVHIPSPLQELLILLALLFVLYIAFHSEKTWVNAWGFGLILGGGLANTVDRLLDVQVTDFIQVGSFPIFNVADSCITLGVALLCLHALLAKQHYS